VKRWLACLVPGALFVLLLAAAYIALELSDEPEPTASKPITIPSLSPPAQRGQEVFNRRCGTCHGVFADGSPGGPPLVHPVYRPAHHADVVFSLAVRRGVRAHHWTYGDMLPMPDVSEQELKDIVQFVRELQRANGIE